MALYAASVVAVPRRPKDEIEHTVIVFHAETKRDAELEALRLAQMKIYPRHLQHSVSVIAVPQRV